MSGLIDSLYDFQTGVYIVSRSTPATPQYDTFGRALTSVITTFTINGSLQPMSGRDLLVLPEAQRSEETRWLFSDAELRTRGPASDPDVVMVNAPSGVEQWVVDHVERWQFPPDDEIFWRCQVSRRNLP